jgi:stalled ribosome alternative rescue factor ArfA
MDKRVFKKEGQELQEYLAFKKRGGKVKNKKGKGSYNRKDKHSKREQV